MNSRTQLQSPCPILIGGAPSSGSTLLSVMLDAHPDIYCGPEIGLLAHGALYSQSFATFAQALLRRLDKCEWLKNDAMSNLADGFCPYSLIDEGNLAAYGHDVATVRSLLNTSDSTESFIAGLLGPSAERQKKTILAEKTPSNLYAFERYLEHFAQGRIIYVVRDPRAVVASLLRRGFSLRRAIAIWLVEVAICERFSNHPRVLQVRYEDLVLETENVLYKITTFLNVAPAISSMMQYNSRSQRVSQDDTLQTLTSWTVNPTQPISQQAIDTWRTELNDAQLALIERAIIVSAPSTMEWLKGTKLAELALRLGYQWEATSSNIAEVCMHLVGARLVSVDAQKFDAQYFHERFVESEPSNLNDELATLWSSVVQGVTKAYAFEFQSLNELTQVRASCCFWHTEYEKINLLLNNVAAEKDRLSSEASLQADALQQMTTERDLLLAQLNPSVTKNPQTESNQ